MHTVITIYDDLRFGPLKSEVLRFSELRTDFWAKLQFANKESSIVELDDLERLISMRTNLVDSIDNKVVYWFDQTANGLLFYYLLLHYFKDFQSQINVINISGLPFLDDDLKIVFPTYLFHISTKEIRKALKLIRPLSSSEFEADLDEWKFLQHEYTKYFRVLYTPKSLLLLDYDGFGELLFNQIPDEPTKISKLISIWTKSYDSKLAITYFHSFIQDLLLKDLVSINNNIVTKL